MRSRLGGWSLLALVLLACGKKAPPPEAAPPSASEVVEVPSGSFPGADPPPLEELLEEAVASARPVADAAPYAPRDVDVPPIQPPPVEMLPRTQAGDPLLVANEGVGLVVDTTLSDPITAAAKCMQLTTACIQPATVEEGRDRDSCVASAKTCASNHPWDETEACCPAACQELYAELRQRKYADFEAWGLVRSSDCFPGMREFMQAAKKADEKSGLAP